MLDMKYIYILSCYGEYGLETPTVATLDRGSLPTLLNDIHPDDHEAENRLSEILKQPDELLSPHLAEEAGGHFTDGMTDLGDGWGCLNLIVFPLDTILN